MKRILLLLLFFQSTILANAGDVIPNRDSSSYYFNLGQEDFKAGKLNTAWLLLCKAADFDSTDAKIQLAIADACIKTNRMGLAFAATEKAYRVDTTNTDILRRLTNMYFTHAQWSRFMDAASAMRQRVPQEKGLDYKLGKACFATRAYPKGIDYLESALKEDSTPVEAFYMMGRMYFDMSDLKTAIAYYEKALTLDTVTSYIPRVCEYAMLLNNAGEYKTSVKWFRKAIEKGHTPTDAFYLNMGNALADAGYAGEAIKVLTDLLSRRPKDMALRDNLAYICYQYGEYKQALFYWGQVYEHDKTNAYALYHLGRTYSQLGDKKGGENMCARAIKMNPSIGVLVHERRR